jgi:hypothetical protein
MIKTFYSLKNIKMDEMERLNASEVKFSMENLR